jgi:gamma-glutamyltranspeptidase/glutathione hydrolase
VRLLLVVLMACACALAQARAPVAAKRFMVSAAHPLATQAGYAVLKLGGNAVDAAIAAQLVLGLVEPEASGIGGGAFLLHWDESGRRLRTYDGRETAPASVREDLFLDAARKPLDFFAAAVGGRSVGVPGVLRLLELVHARHGRLKWADLFQWAIHAAEEGFVMSPLLHAQLEREHFLREDGAAAKVFYDAAGKALPPGSRVLNRAYGATLRALAQGGAEAFYRGEIADDIVRAVRSHRQPGGITLEDLAAYRAVEREPLCGVYRSYRLCSMGPPSSGGVGLLQILGILERAGIDRQAPDTPAAVHLFAEAGRLAYADRDHYVGDPDFLPVPVAGLTDPAYLRERSLQIRAERSLQRAEPGMPPGARISRGPDATLEAKGTTHLSIIDADGNGVAMTSTVESAFGSRVLVHGFLLNNQLTDFSFLPEQSGRPAANRVEPGKRPRSSMAPTFVFAPDGRLRIVLGSAGGAQIINYVAKALMVVLDWNFGIRDAIAAPNMGSRNRDTELERGSSAEAFADALRAMGHPVAVTDMVSGTHGILRTPRGLAGGADPRREGVVIGEKTRGRVPAR